MPGGPAARVPAHVAIIMDGNGRWAKARGLPRTLGHERGVEALRRCVNAAPGLGVTHLTVFSFSTENWSRPADEVLALFALLRAYVSRDLERLHKEGVRIRVIGLREGVPADIVSLIEIAEAKTRNNTALQLTIAFNYGGRAEIVRAAQRLAERVARGELSPDAIDEAAFASELNTAGLPEIDLLIRTSGEFRISNFMLWQLAYAEMVFLPTLWPEFGAADLAEAVAIYAARDRRFGAVSGGKA